MPGPSKLAATERLRARLTGSVAGSSEGQEPNLRVCRLVICVGYASLTCHDAGAATKGIARVATRGQTFSE